MPKHSISRVINVTYRDEKGMYFKYCEDRETSALMVQHRETQRHYRITNKSRWLDFKEERASSALFIPSLWYNSRFLLSFTCKRRIIKLISRYSTYMAPHLSASLMPSPSLFLPTSRRCRRDLHSSFSLSSPPVYCPSLFSIFLSYVMFYFIPLLLLRTSALLLPHRYFRWLYTGEKERGEYYSKQDLHFYDAAIFYRRHRRE